MSSVMRAPDPLLCRDRRPVRPGSCYNDFYSQGESAMKFFLDTANLDEIRDVASTGILDGITTNPSLIAREGNVFEDQLLKICALVNGPISAETVSVDAAGMVEEGHHL